MVGGSAAIEDTLHTQTVIQGAPDGAVIGHTPIDTPGSIGCNDESSRGPLTGIVAHTLCERIGISSEYFGLCGIEIIFDDHHLDPPVESTHTDTVIAIGADNPYDRCTVTTATANLIVVCDGTPSQVVIDVTVLIIVNTIGGYFRMVNPPIPLKIGMREGQAIIDYTNDDGVSGDCEASCSYIPGEVGIDIGIRQTIGLACIEVLPLVGNEWVVGQGRAQVDEVVELCCQYLFAVAHCCQ